MGLPATSILRSATEGARGVKIAQSGPRSRAGSAPAHSDGPRTSHAFVVNSMTNASIRWFFAGGELIIALHESNVDSAQLAGRANVVSRMGVASTREGFHACNFRSVHDGDSDWSDDRHRSSHGRRFGQQRSFQV